MDKIFEHHLLLLKEFDEVCDKLGIRYILANHSAWDAVKFGGYHNKMYGTSVMMTEADLAKLRSSDLPANRKVVEYKKRSHTAKYVDTRAVLLNYNDEPVEKFPAVGIAIVVATPAGNGAVQFARPDGSMASVGQDQFDSEERLTLDGESFRVAKDMSAYLAALAGEEWETKKWPFSTPSRNNTVVFDTDTDVDEFMRRPYIKHTLNPIIRAIRLRYRRWFDGKYWSAYRRSRYGTAEIERTEDRFDLWEQLYPRKQEILAMAQDPSKAEELEQVLEPLLERIWFYDTKKRIGFSIDEELLQVCVPILERRHGAERVQELLDRIPETYRQESVANYLREHNVKHPLLEG